MPQYRSRFHFGVRGLLVDESLLGTSHSTSIDGATVTVVFPVRPAKADEPKEIPNDLFPADPVSPMPAASTALVSVKAVDLPSTVDLIRVDVVETTVAPPDEPGDVFHGGWSVLVDRHFAIARETLGLMLEWERTSGGQSWLGVGNELPGGVGSAQLVDLDANAVIPFSRGLEVTVFRTVNPSQVLSEARLVEHLSRAASGTTVGLAEALLADAGFYLVGADPLDSTRALISAAVACEVKIKDVLRAQASPEQAQLVELLLSNPRDYSFAAIAHWHKALDAVTGVSLHGTDRSLYDRVEGLITKRNNLVHRGVMPSKADATDGVQAASAAFRWLRDTFGS